MNGPLPNLTYSIVSKLHNDRLSKTKIKEVPLSWCICGNCGALKSSNRYWIQGLWCLHKKCRFIKNVLVSTVGDGIWNNIHILRIHFFTNLFYTNDLCANMSVSVGNLRLISILREVYHSESFVSHSWGISCFARAIVRQSQG